MFSRRSQQGDSRFIRWIEVFRPVASPSNVLELQGGLCGSVPFHRRTQVASFSEIDMRPSFRARSRISIEDFGERRAFFVLASRERGAVVNRRLRSLSTLKHVTDLSSEISDATSHRRRASSSRPFIGNDEFMISKCKMIAGHQRAGLEGGCIDFDREVRLGDSDHNLSANINEFACHCRGVVSIVDVSIGADT